MTTGMFEKSAIKLNTILACNFEIVKEEEIMIETKYFTDGCMEILQSTDLDEVLTKNFEKLKTDIEEKEMEGSGWTLHEIMHLEININDYIPLRGGLSTFIEMPTWIQSTRSVVNVKNYDDNYCFIWSVLAAIYKLETNPQRKFQQKHIPSSIAYYTKCSYDEKLSTFKLERSKNCIEWFINELQELAHNVDNILDDIKPMNLTFDEQLEFSASTKCHICTKKFTPDDIKVRDHCHFTGAYRGAAHVGCNLNYQESCTIAVVFHGLSNYDSHFLIKQLKKQFPGTIDLLALNKESYISFTKHVKGTRIRFRFIDSYNFMASSISTLANELEDKDKSISLSFCNNLEEFKLITKKGIFPYDYIDSWEKFNEEQLPSKLDFYSQLNEEHISEIDYNHACNVWEKFHIKNLGEYSDLYLRTDVLLLADIFENFRYFCLKTYELDPAHYFTLPRLSFNAMLKYTEIELELITDADELLFIEGGIRGGLSQCSHRHVIANNKYINEYNPNIEDSYLMYFDVNNLYGFAMASTLPVSDFQWEENFDINKLNSIEDNSEWGYILEVDLDYPVSLHNEHKDLPLAPERRIPPLSTRMKIRKLYRVLKFKQRAWLKPYIDLNTELRTKATSLFAKNLFKSLINICFGKMLESTRSQRIIKLVSSYGGRGGARALISKPNFHSALIIDDLVIIEMKRLNKVKFVYMDTDSAILHIFTPDIYEFIRKECDNFDTSDYPIDNRYNIPQKNKKVPGIMKDECNGKIMKEFIGLRSKAYSFLVENESCDNNVKLHKKAKGVKKSSMKTITFEDYKNCVENHAKISRKQNLIRSEKHQVYTITTEKIALSWDDDKRELIKNKNYTLPWGYAQELRDI
ncbi:uncharacterized protein LOC122853824 [Aphidius gifuensis]|uniref:uncharacterized protein LOC122853824 n=1 Tax=Aphidius gifuensis TaxID=684658 RepID=UPI001CDCBEF1|nr:uncharacterized protein LOC122853824 [Aphidius gifuensis]